MKIKSITQLFLLFGFFCFLSPSPVSAHMIGGNGFASGITHPLLGFDHLLAMVAVGIISTQIGNKAVWKVPGTFILLMIIGGILALLKIGMPYIETGVALSVLLLGVGVALSKKMPLNLAMACVALFALFHGHAHGEEIPTIAHPFLYALGFILSTTLLHIAGILIGHFSKKTDISLAMLRFSGAAISLAGVYFLLYS